MADHDGVVVITVNRPSRRNALDRAGWRELESTFIDLSAASDVVGVVLTGAGERAFVSGADIAELARRTPQENWQATGQRVTSFIEGMPVPVVAAVNGDALGGGCELALACDIRVAVPTARIGLPEVRLGIVPGAGGTQRLVRTVGFPKALEMVLTGDTILADEARSIGLVNEVCAPDRLVDRSVEVLRRIGRRGALAVAAAKQVMLIGAQTAGAGYQAERLATVWCYQQPERRERMATFLQDSTDRED